MAKVNKGDRILVHYTGRLNDGEEFTSSRDSDPLEFEAGGDDVLPGVSEAVVGMTEGEIREVSLPPGKAYGEIQEELIVEVPLSYLPDGLTPKAGMRLGGQTSGQTWSVTVREVRDETVLLDGNHPLAGQILNFEIEVLEILTA